MARILIVDDEERLAAAIKHGLVQGGFAVDVAFTGVDGLWLATENVYDVVILDVMLPGLDGFEVCRSLRSQGIWTPILMLTARNRSGDEVQSLDTGADDYLAKPFSFKVLVARIRALMRRGAAARPVVLAVGNLTLDPASHRCACGGDELELTAREFAVLEFLVRNRGAITSKVDILDNVWDFAFEGDPNIVEVYIARLRRKLASCPATLAIRTVRGAGYRVDEIGALP